MSYKVEFTSTGMDSLEELTSTIQKRILQKIRWLSENFDDVTPQALSADLIGHLSSVRCVTLR
jgi:mRNA interferase RelE/StbE